MRLKHYAATIFIALLAAFALSGAATIGASAHTAADNVCKIKMIEYGVDQPGKNVNANHEFKRLQNPGSASVDVEGWWVQDAYPLVYKLQASKLPADSPFRKMVDDDSNTTTPEVAHFVMPAGSNVYVYNGTGMDGNPTNLTAALYANLGFHHNNAGDTLSLRDKDGTAVDWNAYTVYRARHLC